MDHPTCEESALYINSEEKSLSTIVTVNADDYAMNDSLRKRIQTQVISRLKPLKSLFGQAKWGVTPLIRKLSRSSSSRTIIPVSSSLRVADTVVTKVLLMELPQLPNDRESKSGVPVVRVQVFCEVSMSLNSVLAPKKSNHDKAKLAVLQSLHPFCAEVRLQDLVVQEYELEELSDTEMTTKAALERGLIFVLAKQPSSVPFTYSNKRVFRKSETSSNRRQQTNHPYLDQAVEPTEHKNPVGRSKPRSICIKQTFHSFKNYKSDSFLHCGVSNAAGAVYHFDEGGMHMDVKWPECLSIPIVWDRVSDEAWDLLLEQHYGDEQSLLDYRPYHGIDNNCYSFIIRYLELIGFEDKKEHTKEDIVKRFVNTPMDAFESFYNIQKKLQSQPSYVCDMDEMKREKLRNRAVNCDGCSKTNIHKEAVYYHCEDCSDFDLCNECFNSKKVVGDHEVEHKTLRMTTQ